METRMRPPLVLTIAGSDSDGASGIQADLKTFTALGVYGASAVSMICAVNTTGLQGPRYRPGGGVGSQIDAVVQHLVGEATESWSLGRSAVVGAVSQGVRTHRSRMGRIVLEPVMVAGDGSALISAEGARALGMSLV